MANDDGVRLTPRAMEMRRLIAEQRASGLTVAAFAARRGIKAATLFNWRRRFRFDAPTIAPSPALVPVRIIDDDDDRDRVSSPTLATTPNVMAVELRNARRITVPPGFSADDLRRLIEVVESC